jgi:uncharacterized protein YecE (DUF72 family)
MPLPDKLYLGTVSWSKLDWVGPFYPAKLKPADFLETYARHFRAVEIDSTFYRIPNRSIVKGWKDRTPPGFIFTAKVPRVITHGKVLNNCQAEFTAFLRNIEILDDRLGPLLLQFPYFNKSAFASREQFEGVLRPFLQAVPKDFQMALEIKNKNWIDADFLQLLRDHSVCLAVLVQTRKPGVDTLANGLDPETANCCYVRFMGDRKAIESKTEKWDRIIDDKTAEMAVYANELKKIVANRVPTYVFFSNYYAGFGPGSAKLFEKLWEER